MKVSMSIEGVGELQRNLSKQVLKIDDSVMESIEAEAIDIMRESLLEVPRDTGSIANSAIINPLPDNEIEFGYGAENGIVNPKTQKATTEYMIAVHERLDVPHANGKAKFLEDPINRRKADLARELGAKIKSKMGW